MRKQRAVCALAGVVAIGVTAREIGANLASLLQMLVQNAVQSGVSIAEAGDPSGPLHRRAQQRAGADEEDGQFPWALICIIVILVVGYSCAIFCVVFRQQFEDAAGAVAVEEQAAQQGEEGAAKHAPSSPKVLGPFGMLVPKSPSPRRKAAAAAASHEGAELHLVALPGAAALGTPERGA